MDRRSLIIQSCAASLALAASRAFGVGREPAIENAREPILGLPCDGCEWVFDDQPTVLASRARIAPQGEPGAPMTIEGLVISARGKPAANIVVYAYHTNARGIYPPAGNRHGTLRGWTRTDAAGRYRFDTIRPGAYPGREIPEHVHMHVIEPGVGAYYIDNLEFLDDPLLTTRRTDGRAGSGLVMPEKHGGMWLARRDIALGRHISDYPAPR